MIVEWEVRFKYHDFLCCGEKQGKRFLVYLLRAVTAHAISGLVPKAGYINEPTMERYMCLSTVVSSHFLLSRSIFRLIGIDYDVTFSILNLLIM